MLFSPLFLLFVYFVVVVVVYALLFHLFEMKQRFHDGLLFVSDSSSREMRNRAEKQRRDKLNAYISELYNLVPSAASAPRKLDKTSTLRLSANFLRIHQSEFLFGPPPAFSV